jgi:hypothetical protein
MVEEEEEKTTKNRLHLIGVKGVKSKPPPSGLYVIELHLAYVLYFVLSCN